MPDIIEPALHQLKEWGMVKNEDPRWKYSGGELHVTKNSPLSATHHSNWRQRALFDAQKLDPNTVHFSVVQSMDKAAFLKIRAKLFEFIEEASKTAGSAKEETGLLRRRFV